MARLFTSGFELNSMTTGVEWTTWTGTSSISSTTKRSGKYALRISSLQSGVRQGPRYQFIAANNNGPFFARVYLRIATAPTAANRIIELLSTAPAMLANISLGSDRILTLADEDGNIGSASSPLQLNKWHRIDIKLDRTPSAGSQIVEAKIDGQVFATGSNRNLSAGIALLRIGGNLNAETQTAGDWYFDDVAVNDSTGDNENSYPTNGKVVHLLPFNDGDNETWTDNPNALYNFQALDEGTPDDATSLVSSITTDQTDDYKVQLSQYEIDSDATISLLAVGVRYNGAGANANSQFVVRLKAVSAGTTTESSAIVPANTTWVTNANAAPATYPIVAYTQPGGSSAWTKAALETTQVGLKVSTGDINAAQVSAMWLLVEYSPSSPSTAVQSLGQLEHNWFASRSTLNKQVVDESGYQNHATAVNGANWIGGPNSDQAILFNGSDDGLQLADAASLLPETGDKFSLAYWLLVKSYNNNVLPRIFNKKGVYMALMGEPANAKFGKIALEVNDADSAGEFWADDQTLTLNTWYHVTCTYDHSLAQAVRCKIYLNGVSQTIDDISTNDIISATTGQDFYIAQGNTATQRNLHGALNDFRFYQSRVLTSTEAANLYNGVVISETGLTLRLKMNKQNIYSVLDHKADYFISKGLAATGKTVNQMEREWLQTLPGVTSGRLGDMWREAVAGQGLTPSNKIDQNKLIFYSSIEHSP